MKSHIRFLAESENFKVVSEHENVDLYFKNNTRKTICIGDFYGDPSCAIISRDEKYAVSAGCGLIIYLLKNPYEEFQYNNHCVQYTEVFRDPKNIWWIDALYQSEQDLDLKYFRFVATNNEGENIYKINVETLEIEKLS